MVVTRKYKPAWERIPEEHRSIDLMPATIRRMLDWTIDATQLLSIIVAPAIGLIFFSGEMTLAVFWLYTVALLLAFTATIVFLIGVNPVHYGEVKLGLRVRGRVFGVGNWKALTPVTIIGVVTNLLAAILAGALTAL